MDTRQSQLLEKLVSNILTSKTRSSIDKNASVAGVTLQQLYNTKKITSVEFEQYFDKATFSKMQAYQKL